MKTTLFNFLFIFITSFVSAQNVGVGTTSPTNTFHIVPTSGIDPLRVEGINSYSVERNILVTNPVSGVVKEMHIDSLVVLIKDSINTDNQNIDSVILNGNILNVYIEDGLSASVDLSSLASTGTDDQDIDSVILNGTNLTVYIENGASANVNLSGLQDGTGTDDQMVDDFSLSGTILSLEIENDGQPAHAVNLSSLQDGIGTDDQNIDSVILNGTILEVYIENGTSSALDLSPIIGDTTLWAEGSTVGLTAGDIYPKNSLYSGGDTIVFTQSGRLGINTIAPNDPFEIKGGSHDFRISPNGQINLYLDPTYTSTGWSRGLASRIGGVEIGKFGHYGSGQTPNYSYITGDESRAPFNDPDLVIRANTGNVGIASNNPASRLEVEVETDTNQENNSTFSLVSNNPIGLGNNAEFMLEFYMASRLNGSSTATWDSTVSTISSRSNRSAYARHLAFGTHDDERMRITSNGNIGVGTTIPYTKLTVIGTAGNTNLEGTNYDLIAGFQESVGGGGLSISTNPSTSDVLLVPGQDNTDMIFGSNTGSSPHDESMRIQSNGNVGIGTPAPSELLDVNGNGRFRAVTSGAYANDLSLTANGTLTTASSDRRLKTNISNISYGLDEVLHLNPVQYQWKENDQASSYDLGFIAQEMKEVLPQIVFQNSHDGFYGINYTRIIPVLTKAIQEQQEIIKNQAELIDKQKEEIKEIKDRLEKIEEQLLKNKP